MKFYQYINEETLTKREYNSDDMVDSMSDIENILLENHTKQFLKEFGRSYGSGKFIWRGDKLIENQGYIMKQSRQDRRPRFIDKELHKILSKLSKKLFGWDIRTQGVFTGSVDKALNFGSPAVFIPLTNYKYVYNATSVDEIYRIYDMYHLYDAKTREVRLKDLKEMYATDYKTKGLNKFVKMESPFEAIFKCKYYLLVRHMNLSRIIFNVMKEMGLA